MKLVATSQHYLICTIAHYIHSFITVTLAFRMNSAFKHNYNKGFLLMKPSEALYKTEDHILFK